MSREQRQKNKERKDFDTFLKQDKIMIPNDAASYECAECKEHFLHTPIMNKYESADKRTWCSEACQLNTAEQYWQGIYENNQ